MLVAKKQQGMKQEMTEGGFWLVLEIILLYHFSKIVQFEKEQILLYFFFLFF